MSDDHKSHNCPAGNNCPRIPVKIDHEFIFAEWFMDDLIGVSEPEPKYPVRLQGWYFSPCLLRITARTGMPGDAIPIRA